ncbi:TonB-dependent receptor [Gilvimarinus xylanilyticus]|uniref:TonB-dependent receptor n=1 Tax=Gilvimarinus xylanilyticus TaxID=2944139 RepID=A0A9X2KS05_9GAMM|nr:TonB-dependent receptor [Gilvimarinus xylanilyticus]MCP8897719.1 TonB-dependent receptor [Gilvimarinus xylanilyticus]
MFKRRLLSSSVAMVAALGSLQVAAQDNQEDMDMLLEEVVVTGVRASLNKAIDIKRDSMQVMDAIIAEDIGKLPDNNVVESLQRVPGVQVTDRSEGEVNTVTIRGLTDVSTTVNGRTIFTASGRSMALADLPSTLVSRIDVIKNRSAGQFEEGIAGQIDVHTFRPFDFDGSKVSLAARAVYNEDSEETDPILSGLFSNVWETGVGDFGALVNLSYQETNFRGQSVTPGAQVPFMTEDPLEGFVPLQRIFPDTGFWTPGLDNGLPDEAGSTLNMNGVDQEYYLARDAMFQSDLQGERERTAANISLQFAPNDSSTYTFESMYTGYRNDTFNSLHFSFVDWWGALGELGPIEDTFEVYEGTNVIKERSVKYPFTFTSGDYATNATDSFMSAIRGEWDISDNLTLESELVYQDSEFETEFIAMRGNGGGRYIVNANYSANPFINFEDNPDTADVNEGDLTDLTHWSMGELYDNGARREGEAVTFTTDGEYLNEGGLFHTFNFGLRYDDHDAAEYGRDQGGITCDAGNTTGDAANCQFASYIDEGISWVNDSFMEGEYDVPRSWATPNGEYLLANRAQFLNLYGLDPSDPLMEQFNINEVNTAVYATAQFETELAGMRFDGEIGGRYVNVQTDTEFVDQQDQTRTQGSTETSEFLPSLTARWHFTEGLLMRFNYGETLRMPGYFDLNPTITYYDDITDIGYGTASGGNVDLEPTMSQNLDLSLEWYFGDASSVYVTAFQRDIEGLVVGFRNVVNRDIEGFNTDTFVLSQPDNASNGKLSGIELGTSYFPENLPGLLDGFGIQAALTLLDSEQDIPLLDEEGQVEGTETTDIMGVSDTSYNITLVYDREAFDARLAYVWRSEFFNANSSAQFANPMPIWRDAQKSLDFQLNYDITDDFTVSFNAVNLTGELTHESYGNSPYHRMGNWKIARTFGLGARYSF